MEDLMDIDETYNGYEVSTESSWYLLPDPIVWMIKDRLGFVDNVRMSLGCKNWWLASKSYPGMVPVSRNRVPWIMSGDSSSSSRQFIQLPKGERFTIDLPEFVGARVLFSRQGWLLLHCKFHPRQGWLLLRRRVPSLLLLNPFMKVKYEWVDLEQKWKWCIGSFTVVDGYPRCVVILTKPSRSSIKLMITRVGEGKWSECSYTCQRMSFSALNNILVVGENVYCLDLKGNTVIYDMSSGVWKELPVPPPSELSFISCLVEHGGDVIKLDHFGLEDVASARLSRYNHEKSLWDDVRATDFKEYSWYIMNSFKNNFCFKEKGSKIYSHIQLGINGHNSNASRHGVGAYDFKDGRVRILSQLASYRTQAFWVDID